MTSDFKVQLSLNLPSSPAEVFTVRRNWDLATFKRHASKKMQIKVKRVFLQNGSEVTGCDEMSANELLFVSAGEDFFKSAANLGANLSSATAHAATAAAAAASAALAGASQANPPSSFNVSVLGTGGVGKSAITLRFVRDTFFQDWDPTIEDAYKKTVSVDGQVCVLDVLDTAGQDDFESLRPSWMIGKDGYVFVFSLDQPESLIELGPFFELHAQLNEGRRVPIVLCGNKKDLALVGGEPAMERQQRSREMARQKAKELGAKFIETSAYSGDNVQEVFEVFVKEALGMRRGGGTNGTGGHGGAKARFGGRWACVVM
ncbi:hypothetical protein BASA81_000993 [Batrachochytrium salamandrivorans]|nr:hypothetical protein BASA81_000993 [Batrachochytrium salamandrivorans]